MDGYAIAARRAAGETLRKIAEDLGVSESTVSQRANGRRSRPKITDTARSYVKHMPQIGKCSTDFRVVLVSLARSAA